MTAAGTPRGSGDEHAAPAAGPDADERRGLELLAEAGAAIVAGVAAGGEAYLRGVTGSLLDAWGRFDPSTRAIVEGRLAEAASAATSRVVDELRALLGADPSAQRATPLEIVRSIGREPTRVLRAAGMPEIVRDDFEARALPADVYGLAPRALADLGSDELGPLHLAWGTAKALVLRARAARASADERAGP